MKKLIILTLTVLFAAKASCQQSSAQKPYTSKEDYLRKSKVQKKTARILSIGGAGLVAAALIIPRGELVKDGFCFFVWCDDEYKNDNLKGGLFITGAISMLGSIPFYISSNKNKKRYNAASAFIDLNKYPALKASLLQRKAVPVVGLKFPL